MEGDQSVIVTAGSHLLDRDARYERVCELFPEGARVEMDVEGNVIVVPFSSEDSAYRSGEAYRQLSEWARLDGTGRAFDSSVLYNLPSGAKRSPDASWVAKAVLRREGGNTRRATKTRHLPPFLVEVISPTDALREQQNKCREWVENGVTEAFLLDPDTKTAYIYSAAGVHTIENASSIASKALSGFVLDCAPIWEDLF